MTMKEALTGWYPVTTDPVRTGWYNFRGPLLNEAKRLVFNGKEWGEWIGKAWRPFDPISNDQWQGRLQVE